MTTWSIDPAHTEVGFTVRHMMISTVKGRFTGLDASVEIDEAHPERSTLEASVDVASITTGDEERDAHLRSADFFDAEQHPVLVFRSTEVESRDGNHLRVAGELTIRGITHPVTLEGSVEGPITDPWGGRRAGFTLAGEVDREAYGLTWNVPLASGGVLVGRTVRLTIEAQLVAAAEEREEERDEEAAA